jgi:hypothetical protein
MIDLIAQHTQLHPLVVQMALGAFGVLAALAVVLVQISPRQRSMRRRITRWRALMQQRYGDVSCEARQADSIAERAS